MTNQLRVNRNVIVSSIVALFIFLFSSTATSNQVSRRPSQTTPKADKRTLEQVQTQNESQNPLDDLSKKAPIQSSTVINDAPPVKPNEPTIEQELLKTNRIISDWFDGVAEGIDLFLVGKKISSKRNTSKIVVDNTTYSRESRNLTNLTSVSVNPRFPNLEAYWNLKFSTFEEQRISRTSEGGYARATPKDKNYGATLGLFRRLGGVRVAFQPRFELKDPLLVSHSISIESVYAYKQWKFNPKLQFFADAVRGTGTAQALNFNYEIDETYSLTLLNEGEYEDRTNQYSVNNSFILGQILDDRNAMSYGITFYSNNRPNYHLDAYSFSILWSRVLYKNVLYLQTGPNLDFVKEEQFRGFVGGVINLSVQF